MITVYLAGKVGGKKWSVMPKLQGISYTSSDEGGEAHDRWGNEKEWVNEHVIARIKSSDVLCAFLDEPNCYGSIAEIAYAAASHTPCFVWIENPRNEDGEYDVYDDAYWLVTSLPSVTSHRKDEQGSAGATEFFAAILGQFLSESPVEQDLWMALAIRCCRGSVAFPIAQFEIDRYRLDFAWPDIRIAVEVDGHDYHKTKEQRSYDAKRDRDLLRLGWTTLRYTGSDVFKDYGKVADEIISFISPKLQSDNQGQSA